MKNFLYTILQIFIDFILMVLCCIILACVSNFIKLNLINVCFIFCIIYFLLSNVIFDSFGFKILKVKISGKKIFIFLSNLLLLIYIIGAYKKIFFIQLLGIIDFVGFIFYKNRLSFYMFKLTMVYK